jgi:hypothetical protein
MRGLAGLVVGLFFPAVAAWREWPHVGEGPAKWKRNWMPMEQQNDTYFGGVAKDLVGLTSLKLVP